MPSSLLFVPDPVSVSLSSPCEDMAETKCVYLQQSLLVLINSHLLRTFSKFDLRGDLSLPHLIRRLPNFFQKVGYVSQRFLESALLGVKTFLDCNTISTSHFFSSSSISSFFKSDVQSVCLNIDESFQIEEFLATLQELLI
ncbi:hypothetical protein GEMRC1_009681 [Eukaryota sp. GEM-RC1]